MAGENSDEVTPNTLNPEGEEGIIVDPSFNLELNKNSSIQLQETSEFLLFNSNYNSMQTPKINQIAPRKPVKAV
jgi:hypothetical protein